MGASCCSKKNACKPSSQVNPDNHPIAQPLNPQEQANRWQFLTLPHKGFKKMWADVLIQAGSCDFSAENECESLHKLLIQACESYKTHNFAENQIFQGLSVKDPAVYKEWTQDHDSHIKELEDLAARINEILKEPVENRQLKGIALYDHLGVFISKDLGHMKWEEDVGVKTLWKYYSDEELLKIVQEALKKYDTPESWKFITPFFVQAGGLEQNVEYIMIVKGTEMPKEDKETVLKYIQSLLPQKRVEKLINMKIL